jgi:large subunit ribosomal protein L10
MSPRPEKVVIVDDVRARLERASGAIVTEYRGLSVAELSELRRQLREAGGELKVYKNTLVRLAVADGPHAGLEPFLVGPTALTFVQGEAPTVAKVLRDFSRANPALVVKGGLLDGAPVDGEFLGRLADVPPRPVLLGQLAGVLTAPLAKLAGALQALPRNLAYGLQAVLDQRRGSGTEAAAQAAGEDASSQAPSQATATADPAGAAETVSSAGTEQGANEAGAVGAPAGTGETVSSAGTEQGANEAGADGAAESMNQEGGA